jgi:hypothetical protein
MYTPIPLSLRTPPTPAGLLFVQQRHNTRFSFISMTCCDSARALHHPNGVLPRARCWSISSVTTLLLIKREAGVVTLAVVTPAPRPRSGVQKRGVFPV